MRDIFIAKTESRTREDADGGHDETVDEPVRRSLEPVALETEIIAVFDARPPEDESASVTFRRKEHDLTAVFSRLSAIDSLMLHRRLDLSLPGDPIAERFRRFVVDRRVRLLAFLADARRRIAIQAARTRGHYA